MTSISGREILKYVFFESTSWFHDEQTVDGYYPAQIVVALRFYAAAFTSWRNCAIYLLLNRIYLDQCLYALFGA